MVAREGGLSSEKVKGKGPASAAGCLQIVGGAVSLVVFVGILFVVAGDVGWLRGWAYVGVLTIGHGISAVYAWRKDPELLARRGKTGEGTKNWDKVVLGVFAVMYLAEIVVGALDYRWGWSAMSVWFWPVGVVLYAFFLFVVTWAMSVNTHFEKTVRIQSDRNHRVIDSGPYGIVRHPGYLATIAGFILGVPLLVGSWWAFLPAFAAGACLVVRTFLEDRMLRRELTGYEAYAQRVRYRLIRGLW